MTLPPSAPILETRGLRYRYPGAEAASLDGLDLTVTAGRRLALLGANGAGKTTLLLHLNGTLRPQAGGVWLNGAPAAYGRAPLAAWRQTVGLVLQEPDDQLFAASVAEDVSFGPLNLGLAEAEARARVAESLAALGITPLAERPPHLLSHGQRKRAAIAGILAMRPRVLVLDEPTAGLDHAGETHLLAALEGVAAAGATIVFSTHDVDLALSWADEAAVFAAGRRLAQGPATEILTDRALLTAAGLRVPAAVPLAEALRAQGLAVPPGVRDVAGLAALLASGEKTPTL